VDTLVIQATWEVGIRRNMVWGQSMQKVTRTPISIDKTSMVVHICDPSNVGGRGRRIVV
jgi:hypothetical protein